MQADSDPDPHAIVRNEFASVAIRVDRRVTGDRVIIEDLRGRSSISLDALELERITTLRQSELSWVVSPERGWPDDE